MTVPVRKPLYKTTIVIWSDYDPSLEQVELADLARDAVNGDAYCSKQETIAVANRGADPDWDGTEFFADTDVDWADDGEHSAKAGEPAVSPA